MAGRPRKPADPIDPDAPPRADDPGEEERSRQINEFLAAREDEKATPGDIAVANLLTELGADEDAVVRVYRLGPGGFRDQTFLFTCQAGEFSLPMLQEEPYNGGNFQVYVYRGTERVISRGVKIAPKQGANGTVKAVGDSFAQFADVMQRGFAQMSELIARIPQSMPQPQPVQAAQSLTVQDVLQLIGTLQPILNGARHAPQSDPIELLTKLLALQKEMQPLTTKDGEADTGALILRGAEILGKPLLEMMAAQKGMQNAQDSQAGLVSKTPNPAGAAPGLLPGPPAPTVGNIIPVPGSDNRPIENPSIRPPENPFEEKDAMNLRIAMLRPVILASAQANADTYAYANLILDYFSDDEIGKYIDAPDWYDQLAKLIQLTEIDKSSLRPWFESLRVSVKELLQEGFETSNINTLPPTGEG